MRAIAPTVAVLALSACAVRPVAPPAGPAPLAPSTFGGSQQVQQVLHAAFGDREAVLQGVLTIDPQQIRFLALGSMGERLFSVSFDGKTSAVDSNPMVPKGLPPERLLSDIQFAYWPLAALQANAAGSAWSYSEPAPQTRRLLHDGRLAAEIHYADPSTPGAWPNQLWLANFESGYSLHIQSAPLQ